MTNPSQFIFISPSCRLQSGAIPPARILWLHQNECSNFQFADFQNKLREQGFVLEVSSMQHVTNRQIADADLVLFNTVEQFEGIFEVVMRVRKESQAPLIMLTNGHSTEQLVVILKSGVDAIWSLHAPTDLLVARCKAVLRRWMGAFT